MPRLAADSIVRRYGGRTVLDAAYVDAVAGTVTALVGVTGSGKTTLLEIAVGIRQADSGQLRWDGHRVARPSLPCLSRRGVAYAPATPWLSTRMRVGAQLALASRVWGADWRTVAQAGGVERYLEALPPLLSPGEQRLCELAFVDACRATVLVVDEPFRELDPLWRDTVGQRLRAQAAEGTAVLFADHDARMVGQVADRVFSIEQGRTRLVPAFRDRALSEWYHLWAGGGPYI